MDDFMKACELMQEQLGDDNIVALATCKNNQVTVQNINVFYKEGAVYGITDELTRKMVNISTNPNVSFCKTFDPAQPVYKAWLEGSGMAENFGHPKNHEMKNEIIRVFGSFYNPQHYENIPTTCILKINLTKATVLDGKYKYLIDYPKKTVQRVEW